MEEHEHNTTKNTIPTLKKFQTKRENCYGYYNYVTALV